MVYTLDVKITILSQAMRCSCKVAVPKLRSFAEWVRYTWKKTHRPVFKKYLHVRKISLIISPTSYYYRTASLVSFPSTISVPINEQLYHREQLVDSEVCPSERKISFNRRKLKTWIETHYCISIMCGRSTLALERTLEHLHTPPWSLPLCTPCT